MRLWLTFALACAACAPAPRGSTSPQTDPAKPATTSQPASTSPQPYGVGAEGKSPPAKDVAFEEDKLQPPDQVGGEGFGLAAGESQDLAPIEPSVQTPVPAKDPNAAPTTSTTRGFRVQLAAFASAAEAETVRREAESRLSVGVHVVAEAGLFKVRAGDYLDRGAAVALQTRARGYGYDAAWVVSTEVQVQRP